MNRSDFEALREVLRQDGFEELDARYDYEIFGSWYVVLKGSPRPVRVVWDGKEGWLRVQLQHIVEGDWEDIWLEWNERTPRSGRGLAVLANSQSHPSRATGADLFSARSSAITSAITPAIGSEAAGRFASPRRVVREVAW